MARPAPTLPAGDALLDAATILLAALTALAALGLREAAPPGCLVPASATLTASRALAVPSAAEATEVMLRDLAAHD